MIRRLLGAFTRWPLSRWRDPPDGDADPESLTTSDEQWFIRPRWQAPPADGWFHPPSSIKRLRFVAQAVGRWPWRRGGG